MSRVKRRTTHPPYWHVLKNPQVKSTILSSFPQKRNLALILFFLCQKVDDKISADNLRFVREVIQEKYKNKSPLKPSELQIEKSEWDPKTKRSGVIARNIGMQYMWDKDGKKVKCTVLHV